MIFMIRGEDERLVTVFNAGTKASRFTLPDGTWQLFIDGDQAGIEAIKEVAGAVSVPPLSAMVFVQRSPQHMTDVVAAMIWKEDSFLICQRNTHKARGLLWEFPGGKVASGESDQQALIRECAEELGIQVSMDDIVAQTLFHYPDIDIDLRLYRCTAFPGEIIPNEHDDIRWVHLQDVGGYDFSPADKVLLKQILSR